MTDVTHDLQPEIAIHPEPNGATTIGLRIGGRSVSRLAVVPFTLRIGAANVRMDGIGGVGTDEEYRNLGYSRRVLETAVKQMQQGDAALSMLYGIRDFYPKFGFATAGPDHLVLLTDLERDNRLPVGWTVRPFEAQDLPAVQDLYARNTAGAAGAAVRSVQTEGGVWSRLMRAADGSNRDAARVVQGPEGAVRGYLWRARWCWYVNHTLEPNFKDALTLGEVMADGPLAADAVLAACRLWAIEESKRNETEPEEAADGVIKQVVLAFPPEGPLAAAAMRQDARFIRNYSACGGSMARVLSVTRLLRALLPELQARLRRAAQRTFTGSLEIRTDIGTACLRIAPDHVSLQEDSVEAEAASANGESGNLHVQLSQSDLARLALGAFPPEDILARLPEPPSEAATRLLEILFPLRHPHMYLPDRY